MSTYNGGDKIYRQIDSIMMQKDVDVYINIRDDGSNECTLRILDEIKKKYDGRVKVSKESNLGWKRSFLELVYCADTSYDYYGFSDQDDIWLEEKIINCIKFAEKDAYTGSKLIHCNSISVTPDLKMRAEQEERSAAPHSIKDALAMEYFQGCGMLWNNEAMKLIQKYRLQNENIAHDFWVGLVVYLFGKIYFCKEPQFYHIRYGNNSSADGNKKKGQMRRLKLMLCGKSAYMNPAADLIRGYAEILSNSEIDFLSKIVDYNSNWKHKIEIIFDPAFRRSSISATVLMKVAIVFNKY